MEIRNMEEIDVVVCLEIMTKCESMSEGCIPDYSPTVM